MVTEATLPASTPAYQPEHVEETGFTVVDVNFLDATNFDQLQARLFDMLGLVRVFLLERPAPDAPETTLVVPRASSIGDLVGHASPARPENVTLARIWGSSVRHPGQTVGLEHLVQDGDRIHLKS